MFKLSQETIAIVTVGLALATLIVTGDAANRAEARTDRETLRAEARADRTEAQAAREAFEQHIIRLTQGQSRLTGIVEQMRTAGR